MRFCQNCYVLKRKDYKKYRDIVALPFGFFSVSFNVATPKLCIGMSLLLVTTEVTLDIIILLSLRKYTVSYLNKCVNMPVPFIKTSAND